MGTFGYRLALCGVWLVLSWSASSPAQPADPAPLTPAPTPPEAPAADPAPSPPPDWLSDPVVAPAELAPSEREKTFHRPWQLLPIPIRHPTLFEARSARILPAAAFYSGSGLDTAGNLSGLAAIGLGDVADFQVETSEHFRARIDALSDANPIFPYLTAQLRMGLDEGRLFGLQPAVALGYRKSFERETDGFKTRVAELFLVASKLVGSRLTLHAGLSLWDGFLVTDDGDAAVYLSDRGVRHQLRGVFGLEIQAKPRASILVETFWAPEFRYDTRQVALAAKLAFGVRYSLLDWALFESGVSVPDIEGRDLLEAQIFARFRFINHSLARPYQKVK